MLIGFPYQYPFWESFINQSVYWNGTAFATVFTTFDIINYLSHILLIRVQKPCKVKDMMWQP